MMRWRDYYICLLLLLLGCDYCCRAVDIGGHGDGSEALSSKEGRDFMKGNQANNKVKTRLQRLRGQQQRKQSHSHHQTARQDLEQQRYRVEPATSAAGATPKHLDPTNTRRRHYYYQEQQDLELHEARLRALPTSRQSPYLQEPQRRQPVLIETNDYRTMDTDTLSSTTTSTTTAMSSADEDLSLYGLVQVDYDPLSSNTIATGSTERRSPVLASPFYEDNLYGVVYAAAAETEETVAARRPEVSENDKLKDIDATTTNTPATTISWQKDHLHGVVYAEDFAASKTLSTYEKNSRTAFGPGGALATPMRYRAGDIGKPTSDDQLYGIVHVEDETNAAAQEEEEVWGQYLETIEIRDILSMPPSAAPTPSAAGSPDVFPTVAPAGDPIAEPTGSPSVMETMPPVSSPTATPFQAPVVVVPTTIPSVQQTPPPTVAPATTSGPTMDPARLRLLIESQYPIGGVRFDTRNPSFYQSKAFTWLEDDQRVTPLDDERRIIQRYALACIYYASNGVGNDITDGFFGPGEVPSWSDEAGWLTSEPECTWFGVEACANDGTITSFVMVKNQMSGVIPAEAGFLQNLETLIFSGNFLNNVGPIGHNWLRELSQLRVLDYSENGFFFDGIPPALYELTMLQVYDSSSNYYFGFIQSFDFPPSLEVVRVADNDFSGSLSWMSMLPSLTEVDISDNSDIVGPLPDTFNSELRIFRADKAGLEGQIPEGITAAASSLELFSVFDNKLTGEIPTFLASLSKLAVLDLHENSFQGGIPIELGQLGSLEMLRLDSNDILGAMPEEVCALIDGNLSVLGADCIGDTAIPVPCDCCTCCSTLLCDFIHGGLSADEIVIGTLQDSTRV